MKKYDVVVVGASTTGCWFAHKMAEQGFKVLVIEKNMPDFIDERGVSLILLHTEKGYAVFDAIKDSLIARECPIEKCLQPQLMYPSWVSENRAVFWKEYREKGYDFVAKKYCGVGFLAGAKKFLKNIMRKANLYDIAKKILKKG